MNLWLVDDDDDDDDDVGGANPPWEEKSQNRERELQRFSPYQDCWRGDHDDNDDHNDDDDDNDLLAGRHNPFDNDDD